MWRKAAEFTPFTNKRQNIKSHLVILLEGYMTVKYYCLKQKFKCVPEFWHWRYCVHWSGRQWQNHGHQQNTTSGMPLLQVNIALYVLTRFGCGISYSWSSRTILLYTWYTELSKRHEHLSYHHSDIHNEVAGYMYPLSSATRTALAMLESNLVFLGFVVIKLIVNGLPKEL